MSVGSFFSRLWARFAYDRSIGFGLEYIGLTTLRYPRAVAIAVLAFSILCFTQIPRANVDGDLLRVPCTDRSEDSELDAHSTSVEVSTSALIECSSLRRSVYRSTKSLERDCR